jgi:hypothetical protein
VLDAHGQRPKSEVRRDSWKLKAFDLEAYLTHSLGYAPLPRVAKILALRSAGQTLSDAFSESQAPRRPAAQISLIGRIIGS